MKNFPPYKMIGWYLMVSIKAGTLHPHTAAIPTAEKPTIKKAKKLLTKPQTESSKTVVTRRKSSPTELVDGKMGSDHSSLSVLLLNVTIQSFISLET